MEYCPATVDDAPEMSALLGEILRAQGSARPYDEATVLRNYVAQEGRVACTVARDDAGLLCGFQSLRVMGADNPYGVPEGWGVIGTYVRETGARQGIGRGLFAQSLAAARAYGLVHVDATIASDNARALAYYEAMGFRAYAEAPGVVQKKLDISCSD